MKRGFTLRFSPRAKSTRRVIYRSKRQNSDRIVELREILSLREKLHRLKLEYQKTLDDLPIGIYRTTQEGTFLYANKRLARIYGFRSVEELKDSVHNIRRQLYVRPAVRERLKAKLNRSGSCTGIEYQMFRKDHEKIWVKVNAHLSDQTDWGGPVYEGTVEDVSRRKKVEQDNQKLLRSLKAANAKLDTINQALTEFIHAVAHDFVQPLATTAAALDLLQRHLKRQNPDTDPTTAGFIHSAIRSNSVSTTLAKDLLNYICVVENDAPVETTDLGQVLNDVLLALDFELVSKRASVTVEGELPKVRFPKAHSKLLFLNILGNALKFRGEEAPRIVISTRSQGRQIEICISDNGIGFDNAHAERVFGLFERLEPSHIYPGTGLGLALCKKIVERAGGKIWCSSSPDRGSCFYVTLPLGRKRALNSGVKPKARAEDS